MNSDPKISAVIACVDYSDLLQMTLSWNSRFFENVIVVTSADDKLTAEYVDSLRIRGRNVFLHVTDAFYRNDEYFNKGAALNEGLEIASTGDNWLSVMDADILLPHDFEAIGGFGCVDFQPGTLYVPHRRMLANPNDWTPELDWSTCELRHEEPGGWLQIFHASDPVLQSGDLYPTMWKHAGSCDSAFWMRWGRGKIKRISEFTVLHIGEVGVNWCGRTSKYTNGSIPSDAELNKKKLDEIMRNRLEKRGPGKFAFERIDGRGGLR